MKIDLNIWIYLILFVSLFFTGCQKDQLFCAYENKFCTTVENGTFEQSGEYVNSYLATLKYDDNFIDDISLHEAKLIKLKKWLECKSCVRSIEILCVSCIETYPPQSEIGIEFISSEGTIYKTMDVIMSKPMEFGGFHQ